MKKILIAGIICIATVSAKAQYATANAILDRLEQDRGMNLNLKNVNIDEKKFVLVKDFEDHTERNFVVIKGKTATFAEIFDDKKTGESTSNVFTGDVVRTKKNVLSFRFDKLENKKIAVPITKTMMMTMQKKIIYLIDLNSKDRWIDEASFAK